MNYIELGVIKMKKITHILFGMFVLWSFGFSAKPMNVSGSMDWYGQGSLLYDQTFSDNSLDDGDNDLQRKRRHKRRRKIRPPHKGW